MKNAMCVHAIWVSLLLIVEMGTGCQPTAHETSTGSDKPDFTEVVPVNDYSQRKKKGVRSKVGEVYDEGNIFLEDVQLPFGFDIQVFASNLKNARSLALCDQLSVFIGSRKIVYALKDTDGDFRADRVYEISRGLKWDPMGVAFREGDLYVGEVDRIVKFANIENKLENPPEPEVIFEYPQVLKHGHKYIGFGPDGKLYAPVGAPCNNCLEENPIFASITRLNPDGSGFEIFAHGVRNSRGFDWHPDTGVMWFSDNGRDHLGDDIPPCELNRASEAGLHFGYPFCHGGDIPDPEFGEQRNCDEFVAPAQKLIAHAAPLAVRFYQGEQFPEKYRNQILLCEHGSWNRPQKQGYRISLVTLEGSKAVSYEPFAEGWLDPEANDAWGRPVDLLPLPDGSLLVSDDYAHAVYRISYTGKERKMTPRQKNHVAQGLETQEAPMQFASALEEQGYQVYRANCVACHQPRGEGVTDLHPPLAGSEWVTGETQRLINVMLQGLEGKITVKGKEYYEVMPAQAHLSDQEIAAVLTYIRTSFGNEASPIDQEAVKRRRAQLNNQANAINPSTSEQ